MPFSALITVLIPPTMQHTLVSPGGSRGGRRSGDVTPVEGQGGGGDEVYYTWHAGAPHPSAQARTRNPDTARWVWESSYKPHILNLFIFSFIYCLE